MSVIRRPGSRRPRQTSRRENRHIIRNARVQPTASSAAIQAQSGAANKETGLQRNGTRSSLARNPDSVCSDDNRVREWRFRSERLNPTFTLQRHTAPTAGVMVWGAIAYNTRSPIVLIRGTTHESPAIVKRDSCRVLGVGGGAGFSTSLKSSVFMFLDFAPDLPNESINFTFVWRVSGVIPEFSKSIFSSDKLSDVYRKAEVWSVDYSSGSGSRNSIRYSAGKILNG
ncbi:transposable element Tcb2 transposase [Trichonephila clavipes]|nr:transposable element Tcb2 transposase [Trichonephila clavipes]